MSSAKKLANAVGGKTARACDSCITKRARWYCAADDAFLCQACDSSVHSANPLARRHERVRLKTTSYKASDSGAELSTVTPSWHHGFTKKPRTPRHGKNTTLSTNSSTKQTQKSSTANNHPFHLVPEEEVNSHEENDDDDEAQLLYRVPIFDPFVEAELCSPPSSVNSAELQGPKSYAAVENNDDKGNLQVCFNDGGVESSSLHGFLATEIELAQFAADVESLLGRELENECIGMEELGLIDTNNNNNKKQEWVVDEELEESNWECSVKVEHDEEQSTEVMVDDEEDQIAREAPFELSFDYDDEVKEKKNVTVSVTVTDLDIAKEEENQKNESMSKILLQLDYEAVISAWACEKKSPWTTPHKPNLDPIDNCWPHCMGTCGAQIHHPYGEMFGYGFHPVMGDGGREARVSRYREKRRTRLFSKKIRYEVRKLNAEKRPRMKGRFVKRASFAPPPTFSLAK